MLSFCIILNVLNLNCKLKQSSNVNWCIYLFVLLDFIVIEKCLYAEICI